MVNYLPWALIISIKQNRNLSDVLRAHPRTFRSKLHPSRSSQARHHRVLDQSSDSGWQRDPFICRSDWPILVYRAGAECRLDSTFEDRISFRYYIFACVSTYLLGYSWNPYLIHAKNETPRPELYLVDIYNGNGTYCKSGSLSLFVFKSGKKPNRGNRPILAFNYEIGTSLHQERWSAIWRRGSQCPRWLRAK